MVRLLEWICSIDGLRVGKKGEEGGRFNVFLGCWFF